jgi:leucine dehydrogenase
MVLAIGPIGGDAGNSSVQQRKGWDVNISESAIAGFERIVRGVENGYHGIVVIHSTALGPAVGGTRFWNYASEEDALRDAQRLARGMTYKNALAGLPIGGGKSVILGDNRIKDREALFRAHGRLVESLQGTYITAQDVGTTTSDMRFVLQETRHVGGWGDDPSPITARGVFRAMQAAAKYRWGSDDLAGKTVALQGCGNVGYGLAERLHAAGVRLLVSDVDEDRVQRAAGQLGAIRVLPDEIYGVPADIFAPCGLGAILNDETIPQLRTEMVVGAANNQLLEPRHGEALRARGILYAPDYAANAGGIISFGMDCLKWDREFMLKTVDGIYDTLLNIFAIAEREGIATSVAADRLAEERISRQRQAAD